MMHEKPPDKLPYDPTKFVNRKSALGQMVGAARRLVAGLPVERRVFFACGERGCGKTWFLRHVAWELKEHQVASALYLNLPDAWAEEGSSIRLTIERIDAEVQRASNPSLPLVLLIDGIEDVPPDLIKQLEERVLAPAAQNPRILIAIAERGGPRHWSGPEFREKSTRIEVGPYEKSQNDPTADYVQEQIERQVPHSSASLEDIKKWGASYPWSTYLLARDLQEGGAALQGCARLLLGPNNEGLYEHLETLAVLQAFDDVRIGALLATRFPAETWEYLACLQVRKDLLATTMVHWEKEKRGYVIDEPLRLLLEGALYLQDQDLWIKLHCVAYRLYEQWSKDFEQSRADWEKELTYHENALKQGGYAPADCPLWPKHQEKEKSHG